jgi:hypothetical protein
MSEPAPGTGTTTTEAADRQAGLPVPWTKRVRGGWVIEAALGVAIFLVYDQLRDKTMDTAHQAAIHARQVVDFERFFGIYQERRIQQWFIHWHWFLSFWNIYYGTIHFVMPVVALVVLYHKTPTRYLRWRNTLIILLLLGLVGFWLYPLTPPRLMPASYGFVDTAARFFNFGPQQPVHYLPNGEPTPASTAAFGNLYAAMPSLHMGWSTWSALALLPVLRHTWLKILVCVDPVLTFFAIVVTANHWILDAIGGWVALAIAYGLAVVLERVVYDTSRRRPVSTS